MITLTTKLEMQQAQPQFFENLMKQLDTDEQQVLQNAVKHADVVAAEAVQKAQAAQAQAAQTNGS